MNIFKNIFFVFLLFSQQGDNVYGAAKRTPGGSGYSPRVMMTPMTSPRTPRPGNVQFVQFTNMLYTDKITLHVPAPEPRLHAAARYAWDSTSVRHEDRTFADRKSPADSATDIDPDTDAKRRSPITVTAVSLHDASDDVVKLAVNTRLEEDKKDKTGNVDDTTVVIRPIPKRAPSLESNSENKHPEGKRLEAKRRETDIEEAIKKLQLQEDKKLPENLSDFDKLYEEMGNPAFYQADLISIFEAHPDNNPHAQDLINCAKLDALIKQCHDDAKLCFLHSDGLLGLKGSEKIRPRLLNAMFQYFKDSPEGKKTIISELRAIFITACEESDYERLGSMIINYPYAIKFEDFPDQLTEYHLIHIVLYYGLKKYEDPKGFHEDLKLFLDALYEDADSPRNQNNTLVCNSIVYAMKNNSFPVAHKILDFILSDLSPGEKQKLSRRMRNYYADVIKKYPLNVPENAAYVNNIAKLHTQLVGPHKDPCCCSCWPF